MILLTREHVAMIEECPRCHSRSIRLNGKARKKQRYLCKDCHYNFTVATLERGFSQEIRNQAVELHRKGMSFRSIERLLGISHVSVMNWVKASNQAAGEISSEHNDSEESRTESNCESGCE